MENVNIVEMLNLVTGDNLPSNVECQGFVVSKRADSNVIKGAVIDALVYIDIYQDNQEMLDENDKVYTNDDLDAVVELIMDFASETDDLDKTVWFE